MVSGFLPVTANYHDITVSKIVHDDVPDGWNFVLGTFVAGCESRVTVTSAWGCFCLCEHSLQFWICGLMAELAPVTCGTSCYIT